MSEPGKHSYEWLATALSSIAAYYAIRSANCLPHMLRILDDLGMDPSKEHPEATWIMHNHVTMIVLAVLVYMGTLASIWRAFRGNSLVVALGLVVLVAIIHLNFSVGMAWLPKLMR